MGVRRSQLEKHAVHSARKRFGQNFLVDRGVINAIIEAMRIDSSDHLIEIGPGLGALTVPLMQALSPGVLQVVELDRDLVRRLRQSYGCEYLMIHEADVLDVDFAQFASPLRVVGNLPYNISSPLLFHLLRFVKRIQDQHFMLQKEVVERMCATPGSAAYGRLSVMLQVHYHMEKLFDVPRQAFHPAPKVTSAVVRMVPKLQSLLPEQYGQLFARLVTQAFSQRRKMLRNTLREYLPYFDLLGIAPTARAEEISLQTYIALTQAVATDEVKICNHSAIHTY